MKIKIGYLILFLFISTTKILAIPESERVISLLEGRHWELHEEHFLRLGEGVDEVLREISDNTSLINYLRFRALAVLALYENDATADHLERHSRSPNSSFARRGFSSLSQAFSSSQPDRVQSAAQNLLESSDPHLRIEAAREMRQLDMPAFKNFLDREPEAWVRQAVRE